MSDIGNMTINDLQEMLNKLGNMATPTNDSQPVSTDSPIVEITLTEAKTEWINHLVENDDKSKSTRTKYEEHTRIFTKWHGDTTVQSVKTSDITEYRDYLQDEKLLKHTSVNVILVGLRQFFNYCKDSGYIDTNPTLKVKRLAEVQLAPKSLDEITVNKMRNAIENWCKEKGKWEQLMMFNFAISCGLRVGEITSLRFHDVQYETDSNGNECAFITVRKGKGNKYREVYMPDDLLQSFRGFVANLNRSKNPHSFIFAHHGKPYGDSAIRAFYWRICRDYKLTHISPHQLRHTFACRRINSGEKMNNLQSDMGHSSWSTTSRYLLPNRDDKRESRNL